MFFMIIGIITGVVLGALALLFTAQKPTLLGWVVIAFGAIALIAILPALLAIIFPFDPMVNPVFSIVAGVACMVSGIGAVAFRRHRSWQVWLGLALGAVPVLFWLLFTIGEILFPHS